MVLDRERARVLLVCALVSVTACRHPPSGQGIIADTAAASPQTCPRVVNYRPTVDAPDYYVEVKPEFDQAKYAFIIASRVGGKVGYIYCNFHAFSIHTIPDSMVAKIRLMPEVSSAVKSRMMRLE
jgi:hypothetical protein